MDLIFTEPYDPSRRIKELGYLTNCQIDVEIGTILSNARNDFEIILHDMDDRIRKGSLIYTEDNSEIGGVVYGMKVSTANNEITLRCKLWRGMLMDHAVKPPKGHDYYTFSGDANELLRHLITNNYDGLIIAAEKQSNINVSVKVRYATVLKVIEDVLMNAKARLHITFDGSKAVCEAVPIKNLSDKICLDNDYGIPMIAEDSDSGYNHIIALGQGELANRQVIELWRLSDGTITEDNTKAVPAGIELRTYIYDYSSVESLEELRREAIKKLNELVPTKKLEIEPGKLQVGIGDIVSATERTTGISMVKQVSRKIIKGEVLNGASLLKTEYKVGD